LGFVVSCWRERVFLFLEKVLKIIGFDLRESSSFSG
jgi:hypothetical protein